MPSSQSSLPYGNSVSGGNPSGQFQGHLFHGGMEAPGGLFPLGMDAGGAARHVAQLNSMDPYQLGGEPLQAVGAASWQASAKLPAHALSGGASWRQQPQQQVLPPADASWQPPLPSWPPSSFRGAGAAGWQAPRGQGPAATNGGPAFPHPSLPRKSARPEERADGGGGGKKARFDASPAPGAAEPRSDGAPPPSHQVARVAGGQAKAGGGGSDDGAGRTVYVWDLDETLILFQSLLTGQWARAVGGDVAEARGLELGGVWERLILDLCDNHMFFKQMESIDQPSLRHIALYDDGADLGGYDFGADGLGPPTSDDERRKLAYRYRYMVENVYLKGLELLLEGSELQDWLKLLEDTDAYCQGWISAGRALVQKAAAEEGTVNVLVTSGQLVPTFAKCLLYKLDELFQPFNVYSSRSTSKLQCFEWVRDRFGAKAKYCAIGDGPDELEAAEKLGWPFVLVSAAKEERRIQNLSLESIKEAAAQARPPASLPNGDSQNQQ